MKILSKYKTIVSLKKYKRKNNNKNILLKKEKKNLF